MRIAMMLVLMTGCATARNIARTSELTGCAEPYVREVAYQQAEAPVGVEPTPELGWYRGCARTLVCVTGSEPECFDAEPSEKPVVVERGDDGAAHLREREEYRLPGLTHEQTVNYVELVADRKGVEGSVDPGDSHCNFFGGGWGSGGGPAVILLLPVIAIVGAASIICMVEHGVQAGRYQRLVDDTNAIADIERRMQPSGPAGACTERDLLEMRRAGVTSGIAQTCRTLPEPHTAEAAAQ